MSTSHEHLVTSPDEHRYDDLRLPHPLRRHQQEALDALDGARAADRQRMWVALPPGAGKTLVGLETIRREAVLRPGARTVVLVPNTAIQGQWVRGWRTLRDAEGRNPFAAGADRDLTCPVTVLTYQALAVFSPHDPDDPEDPEDADDPEDAEEADVAEEADDPAGPGEADGSASGPVRARAEPGSELARLHPRGRDLVERLRAAGPLTLVLDECHHLLEVWGRLLAEVVEVLPDATVLGLTATPPTSLTADQQRLVGELFGEICYSASIPAVVREGHLAPFADLVWLTPPTPSETDYLQGQATRFAELTTSLLDPTLGSTPFLAWADRRFAGPVPFGRVLAGEPELGSAALRLRHAGLLALPGAPELEQHAHDPTTEDWATLVGAWHDECLADGGDPRDEEVRAALRRALPAVGLTLTGSGVRRGRTPVDRVLARSEAKAQAMVSIVAAESRALGPRMAMLVVCDHESASSTVPADLRAVQSDRAGSARLALALLLADAETAALSPLLITGRTVAGAPAVLERLRERVAGTHPDLVVGAPDDEGVAVLRGSWRSRSWVRAATELLSDGGTRVLVGTRALLGEGWDAPALTGLVDLSMAGTTSAVVQTRGRTLRLDPRHPDKVAVNWTVACVAEGHPSGGNDWQRAVTKHRGYLGVDDDGQVVDGVAHVHRSFSPFAPPPAATFETTNAAMLLRAERRDQVAEAWRVGEPYDDSARLDVWVRGARTPSTDRRETERPPEPPALRLGPDGPIGVTRTWQGRPAVLGVAAVTLLVATALAVALLAPETAYLAAAAGLLAAGLGGAALATILGRRRGVIAELGAGPDPVGVAYAVADALHATGQSPVGADGVGWTVADLDEVRFALHHSAAMRGSGVDPVPEEDSERFARAVAEAVAPVADPRYLVPRHLAPAPTLARALLPLSRLRPAGVVWHPVPSALGGRADLARAYADAWGRWVGGGPALYTGSPEGTGVLVAARGLDPLDATAVLRLTWR